MDKTKEQILFLQQREKFLLSEIYKAQNFLNSLMIKREETIRSKLNLQRSLIMERNKELLLEKELLEKIKKSKKPKKPSFLDQVNALINLKLNQIEKLNKKES